MLCICVCVQVLQHEVVCVAERDGHRSSIQIPFMPQESVVKWNKRTTSMRIHVCIGRWRSGRVKKEKGGGGVKWEGRGE